MPYSTGWPTGNYYYQYVDAGTGSSSVNSVNSLYYQYPQAVVWTQVIYTVGSTYPLRSNSWVDDPRVETAEQGLLRTERARMGNQGGVAQAVSRQAEEVARALLLQHLTPQQAESLRSRGSFDILVGDKVYEICADSYSANVYLKSGMNGERVRRYCCHLSTDLPLSDHLLAQKVMLEHCEPLFLAKANIHPLPPVTRAHTVAA